MMRQPKFERMKSMPPIKREIISYLFDYVAKKPQDRWYKYKGEFKYDGKEYLLEAECRMDNQVFTYRNMIIEHKQVVIDIDEMVQKGLIH
jgi:hypothetical protein